MPILLNLPTPHVPVKVWTDDLDAASRAQLENVARLPIVHHHVAAMPDVHLGIGATIGAVIATRAAIVPAAVGVDIGCGMLACRLTLSAADLDEKRLRRVFDDICRNVPVGRAQHDDANILKAVAQPFAPRLKPLTERHPELLKTLGKHSRWPNQLGTLGSGNHFIELCLDETGQVWLMLHSGSRGIGKAMAEHFIALARQDMARELANLPDRDLAWLAEGQPHFTDYVAAVSWAQDYAQANRAAMQSLILAALGRHLPTFAVSGEVVNCHHNYVAQETHYGARVWVTRKGAIRARQDDYGIIPGSMGARSYIVRGKGNPESFSSCAHGAGRRMSRSAAQRAFKPADLARQTEGILCRKDAGVLDEIPAAYKDIDTVMAQQSDLVEVVHTLKQVLCIKG